MTIAIRSAVPLKAPEQFFINGEWVQIGRAHV